MEISAAGRIIGEQVIRSSETFTSGLAQSIANKGDGAWGSGPLWDAAILSMRTHGGGLAQNLENLKLLGADVFEQLSLDVRNQLDDRLKGIKLVMDEIHTDRGGRFVDDLHGFDQYGQQVASELAAIFAKADAAKAEATTVINGVKTVDWTVTDDTVKETVKVTDQAGEQIARSAGAS